MTNIGNYIHGTHAEGLSNNRLSVFDPSTGEQISKVVLSNNKDFDKVVESSKKALPEWSNFTPLRRSRILSKYKN